MLSSALRCTPPMPPVAKTRMPARAAAIIVAATVVAPVRRSAIAKARSARDSFIAPSVCGQRFQLRIFKADMQDAVDDGDRCRHGTFLADDRLDAAGHVQIAGIGHAMGDDGRFQRHERRAARLGGCDLVGIFHRQKGRRGLGHRLSFMAFYGAFMTGFRLAAQARSVRSSISRDIFSDTARGERTVMPAAATPGRRQIPAARLPEMRARKPAASASPAPVTSPSASRAGGATLTVCPCRKAIAGLPPRVMTPPVRPAARNSGGPVCCLRRHPCRSGRALRPRS